MEKIFGNDIVDGKCMEEKIDNMLDYMHKINHATDYGMKIANSSVSIRVADETIELPLNADTYNAIYYMLERLK